MLCPLSSPRYTPQYPTASASGAYIPLFCRGGRVRSHNCSLGGLTSSLYSTMWPLTRALRALANTGRRLWGEGRCLLRCFVFCWVRIFVPLLADTWCTNGFSGLFHSKAVPSSGKTVYIFIKSCDWSPSQDMITIETIFALKTNILRMMTRPILRSFAFSIKKCFISPHNHQKVQPHCRQHSQQYYRYPKLSPRPSNLWLKQHKPLHNPLPSLLTFLLFLPHLNDPN